MSAGKGNEELFAAMAAQLKLGVGTEKNVTTDPLINEPAP
jgi:hypothetical protein